ncbi:MAG: lipid II flippase MurJ, partial [Telluria sp.]
QPGWGSFFFKLMVAVTVMGAVAWFGQAQFNWIAMRAQPFLRAGALLAIITACGISYFAVLGVLGFRPRDFKRRAK